MDKRPHALQVFLDDLRHELETIRVRKAARQCIERVFTALDRPRPITAKEALRLPACAHLEGALATAHGVSPSLSAIAASFKALEPNLTWTRRAHVDATASSNFVDGHANAMIVGPNGFEPREDIWVGVSLLAPHVRYPDHHHAPEEVYLVLSPGKFRQDDGDWFEPGVGGSFYNTPNIKHAMASGDSPLFAIWCLAPAK
jgi:quercetin dioxygenase-like cupin family protein